MRTISLLFAILLFTTEGAAPLHAQAELREGVKIRVTAPGTRSVGAFKSFEADSLVMFAEPGATRFAIGRPAIERIEVSHGRSAAAGARKGALWGGAIWGGINTALVIPEGHKSVPHRAMIALIQTGVGAGIGAIIGSAIQAERWESIALTPSVSASTTGIGLGVSVR